MRPRRTSGPATCIRRVAFAAWVFAVASVPVNAQSLGLLKSAFERSTSMSLHNWRFDRVRVLDGRKTQERCKGISYRAAQCRLRFIDGMPPSAAELAHYEQAVAQPVTVDLPNPDLLTLVNPNSARPAGQDAANARYVFAVPKAGVISVDREEGFVTSIVVEQASDDNERAPLTIEWRFLEIDDAVVLTERYDRKAGARLTFSGFVPPYQ
ncbi:MAG: hypothetical protein AAF610_01785 [Pseudomonadota bacterium]